MAVHSIDLDFDKESSAMVVKNRSLAERFRKFFNESLLNRDRNARHNFSIRLATRGRNPSTAYRSVSSNLLRPCRGRPALTTFTLRAAIGGKP
jgi:hypothetical protein